MRRRALCLLPLLALLAGCAFVDRTTNRIIGSVQKAPPRDPLYLQLQLTRLADGVVTELVQETEQPLAATKTPYERGLLLRLRLDYASALWNAAVGPNPFANAVDMLVTLAVGRKQLERSPAATVLGASLSRSLALLAAAEREADVLVRPLFAPVDYQALQVAIETKGLASAEGGLANIDLEKLLGGTDSASRGGHAPSSLLGILGVDPFAGLDPATRELAQSRQFGERVLFSIQRLPWMLRLNGELLSSDVSRDLGVDHALTSLDRASAAMSQMADTATRTSAWLRSDLGSEVDGLATLASDYRAAFEAANGTAATTDRTLQTFGAILDRLQRPAAAGAEPARPFDVTEYAQTATRISEAAINLTGLLGQVEVTLDSAGATTVAPHATAFLNEANARGRHLLYTAFALGCALIVFASVAVLATAAILRRGRGWVPR